MKILIRSLAVLFIFVSFSSSGQNATLYWNLANAQYSNGEFTFDVEFRSSDNGTMMNATVLQITYSQNTFADPVEADVSINPTFSTGFWVPQITINNDGLILVSTLDFFNTGVLIPQEPEAYINFCTITLEVTDPCNVAGISFDQSTMNGQSTYVPSIIYVNNYVNDWSDEPTGYVAPATTTWTGSTDSDWLDASNWSNGIPCTGSVVTIPDVTNYPMMDANGYCSGVTINPGGKLTVDAGVTLDVDGSFTIESSAGGNGSFINKGTTNVSGTQKVQCYMSSPGWHGFNTPVDNDVLKSGDLVIPGTTVWMKEYHEDSDTWTDVISLEVLLGDMQGWVLWVDANHTYDFTGNFRTSENTSLAYSGAGYGYNFVGNPLTSAVNWDLTSGWGGSNYNPTIWIWDHDNSRYMTYNRTGGGTNGGTEFIPMNQGFFVEATAGGSISVNTDAAVHNDTPFAKNSQSDLNRVTLTVFNDLGSDETAINFIEGATVGYDDSDAHKLFGFNNEQPQLFSTANNKMAINSLPLDYNDAVAIDVTGADGSEMTISLTEAEQFEEVYLEDNYTDIVTDLKLTNYTFIYDADVEGRFNVLFSVTDIEDNNELTAKVYGYNNIIKVYVDAMKSDIAVTNLLGQTVAKVAANSTETIIPVNETGIYVVTVSNDQGVISEKVFIK